MERIIKNWIKKKRSGYVFITEKNSLKDEICLYNSISYKFFSKLNFGFFFLR